MEGLGKLDVDLVNVHAAGGTDMMKAAGVCTNIVMIQDQLL